MNSDVGDTQAEQDEYAGIKAMPVEVEHTKDHKGRIIPQELTDRELQIESVILLRAFGDALEQLGQNPMLKAMMPGKFGR